jgi:hypothetical protein
MKKATGKGVCFGPAEPGATDRAHRAAMAIARMRKAQGAAQPLGQKKKQLPVKRK